MKKTIIRTGVWETNSSSTHSLSIAGPDVFFMFEPIFPDNNGVITLTGGEYGWDYFKFNDAFEKANYVAQAFSHNEDFLSEIGKMIKEQCGAEKVVFEFTDGYIDHQSVGIVPNDMEQLRNLIFNRNSWIFGGNDNSETLPTFYDVPVYVRGGVKQPKYRYMLKIDGLAETTSFKKKPTQKELTEAFYALLDGEHLDDTGEFHNFGLFEAGPKFEFCYRSSIDFKNQTISFIREDLWAIARKIYDQRPESKTEEWGKFGYYKVLAIEKELEKKPEYAKHKKFEIIGLKNEKAG